MFTHTDEFHEETAILRNITGSQSLICFLIDIARVGDATSCSTRWINSGRLEYLNTTLPEVSGMGHGFFHHYLHPDDHELLPVTLKKMETYKSEPYIEMIYRAKDMETGEYNWFFCHVCPHKLFANGSPSQVLVVAMEIFADKHDLKKLLKTIQKICHRELILVLQILSDREKQVLGLIVSGHSDTEISDILEIKFNTARAHRYNIMEKTDAKNVAHLVAMAVKSGEYE
jgi:DNA-binding CsgD family transcriptional regulator